MMPTLLSVENLTFYRHTQLIIDNLSFDVERGECLALTGPNGAGKTTTLNLLAGLIKPHAGTIFIQGVDFQKEPVLIKKQIGFLPEKPPLYYELTVLEYLRLAAKLRRIPKELIEATIQKTIERLDLLAYQNYLIGSLSRGSQQRVGIAQAMLHEPDILILDEPTQGLDETQMLSFQALLSGLKSRAAIILSTHYLHEVKPICDKMLQFSKKGIELHDFRHCESGTVKII